MGELMKVEVQAGVVETPGARLGALARTVDGLPGLWVHQDHEFEGPRENLQGLARMLEYETGWQVLMSKGPVSVMVLQGRDPWVRELGERLWLLLEVAAQEYGCELTGRGSWCPDDEEREEFERALRAAGYQVPVEEGLSAEG